MKKYRTSIFLVLAIMMLSGCGTSSQNINSEVVTSEPTPTADPIDFDMKNEIAHRAKGYLDFNCTPKYSKSSLLGPKMTVYNSQANGLDADMMNIDEPLLLNSDTTDATYGNFAIRTLVLASYYHWVLSGIYYNFYSGYYPELKSYKKSYILFKSLADRAAKKICKTAQLELENTALSESTIAKVQPIFDELSTNWPVFQSWLEPIYPLIEANNSNTAAEIDAMNTPVCKEYPTADGKYTVVKCTVPQG